MPDGEVVPGAVEVTDRLASEYQANPNAEHTLNRFVVYGNVMVRTGSVNAVQNTSLKIGELVRAGVVFTAEGPQGRASLAPYYLFTKLNDVKLEMLTESTHNARSAAEQFARDANVPLGPMLNATQGTFTILPGDNMPGAIEESQIVKTVRVVSTVSYGVGD